MKRKGISILVFILFLISLVLVGCGKKATYNITYILDGEQIKVEEGIVGEQKDLLKLADSEFSGWFLDFKFTKGAYLFYVNEDGSDVTFYGTLSEVKEYDSVDVVEMTRTIAQLDETATEDNRLSIVEAYNSYIYFPDELQEEIENRDKLLKLYEEVKVINERLVKAVNDAIALVKEANVASFNLAKDARRLYDELPADLRKSVVGYDGFVEMERKLSELKSISVIKAIEEMPYKIAYSDIDKVYNIVSQYSKLSPSEQAEVYNKGILDHYLEQVDKFESAKNVYILGDYKYNSVEEMKDAFFGDFYKYVIENYNKKVDATNLQLADMYKPEYAKYFSTVKETNLIDKQGSEAFLGYCYSHNMYVDLIEYLIGMYPILSGQNSCLFTTQENALAYFVNAFDKLEEVSNPFGVVSIDKDSKVSYEYAKFSEWDINGNVYTAKWVENYDYKVEGIYMSGLIDVISSADYAITQKEIDNYDDIISEMSNEAKACCDSYYDFVLLKYNFINKDRKASATNTDIIISSSKAFNSQGNQLQYEQYNLRDDVNPSPEDASQYRTLFLCCSHFCQAAYHYAFGYTVYKDEKASSEQWTNYMLAEYGKKEDIVFFIDCTKYTSEADQAKMVKEIQDTLQPGDIIVYRRGETKASSGHCMIYYGNKKLIHSTGASYKVTSSSDPAEFYDRINNKEIQYGGVAFDDWDFLFTPGHARYLLSPDGTNKKFYVGIIRPLVYDLTPTDDAMNRYLYPELSFEKSTTVTPYLSCHLGEEITYTVDILNNDTKPTSALYVSETIPENAEFVACSEGGIYNENNRQIVWDLPTLYTHSKTKVTYTLRVKNDKNLIGEEFIDDKTYVNGIRTNIIKNFISKEIDADSLANVAKNAIGKSYDNSMDFIRDVYSSLDMDIIDSYNIKKHPSIHTDEIEWMVSSTMLKADIFKTSQLYPIVTLYNGYDTYNSSDESLVNNERCKLARTDYYEPGDIILIHNTYKTDEYLAYLFVSDNLILTVSNGKVVEKCNTKEAVDKFIETFIAYEEFITVRPAREK